MDGKRRKGTTLARWVPPDGVEETWVVVGFLESFDATRLVVVAATPLGRSRWRRSHCRSLSNSKSKEVDVFLFFLELELELERIKKYVMGSLFYLNHNL